MDPVTPVRWCPLCGKASTLSLVLWEHIECETQEVVCASCLRVPLLWLKEAPR